MINPTLARRQFLAWGSVGFSAFLLQGLRTPLLAAENHAMPLFANPEALGQLGEPDANGLRLLPGFQSRIIARSGQPVVASSAFRLHASPDGGATFPTPDGGWVYVSNSEMNTEEGGGGVGSVRFSANGEIQDAYAILTGTNNNLSLIHI